MTQITTSNRPAPQVTDRATWQARIDELRIMEKAHTRAGDALAAERRRLPMIAWCDVFPMLLQIIMSKYGSGLASQMAGLCGAARQSALNARSATT